MRRDPQQYSQALTLIKELVNGFNNHELSKLVSSETASPEQGFANTVGCLGRSGLHGTHAGSLDRQQRHCQRQIPVPEGARASEKTLPVFHEALLGGQGVELERFRRRAQPSQRTLRAKPVSKSTQGFD